jgi:hypothetical protein
VSAALATFVAYGGAPPDSYERIEVGRDGTVRARVETAWPDGVAADQAGLFEWRLDDGELGALVELLDRLGPELADAPGGPGAGSFSLEWADRSVEWAPFEDAPQACREVGSRFAELRAAAREHPVAAVRLALAPGPEFRFEARGREPVPLTVGVLSALAEPAGGEPPSPLWVRRAVEVGSPRAERVLAPGETLTLPGEAVPDAVYGFAEVGLTVGERQLSAVLAAGPLG